jgi:hypothetical protein
MNIHRTTPFAAAALAIALLSAAPAMAQTCTHQGNDVTCDDGKRGIFTGDAIIWADGTRSNLASQHPSVIVGNKPSVIVGQGVMVGSPSGVGADGESERANALPRAGWRGVLLLRVRHSGARVKRASPESISPRHHSGTMDSGPGPSGHPGMTS